jgi:hypothetical protein
MSRDPAFDRAVDHFNREEFRPALLAFEECWHAERTDFLRALIQLSNALNQLRLGLVTSPRVLLASADALLAPYEPTHQGIDVGALRDYIADVRAGIPNDLQTGQGSVPWDGVPRMELVIFGTSL